MEQFEQMLKAMLKSSNDISTTIIECIGSCSANANIVLSNACWQELISYINGNEHEEDVWEKLLSCVSAEQIPDEIICYLIQKKYALMSLCHLPLADKWLKQLIAYDDAPMYTLAQRQFLNDQYSFSDFICFYKEFLYENDDIALYLLEMYKNAKKYDLLLFLCSNNQYFNNKEKLQWYIVANQIKTTTDPQMIADKYKEYQKVGVVLLSIVHNYFAPNDILVELASLKGIANAAKIRKISEETLKLKKNIFEQ